MCKGLLSSVDPEAAEARVRVPDTDAAPGPAQLHGVPRGELHQAAAAGAPAIVSAALRARRAVVRLLAIHQQRHPRSMGGYSGFKKITLFADRNLDPLDCKKYCFKHYLNVRDLLF